MSNFGNHQRIGRGFRSFVGILAPRAAAGIVIASLLVACASAVATPAAPSTASNSPAASSGPLTGGELNVGINRIFQSLDPHKLAGQAEPIGIEAIFDRLVVLGHDGEYHPWLATQWEVSEDEKVWTFDFRDDVMFHDGTPFNAEALKFNLDRAVDPATASPRSRTLLGPYMSSEILDEFRIQITFDKPYAVLLDSLSQAYLGIVSPTAVQTYGDDFENHLVGSGPFKFVEWERQSYLKVERNPDYQWGPPHAENQGPAYLDTIVFKFIPETATREALLEQGSELDVTGWPSASALRRWEGDASIQTTGRTTPGAPWLNALNVSKAPTDELAVRQALNYAVDRETIVNVLFVGVSAPAYSVLSSGTGNYDETAASIYSYDPDKAAALLEEAGWVMGPDGTREKNGNQLVLDVYQSAGADLDAYKPLLCEQIKAVGVGCNLQEVAGAQRNEVGRAGTMNLVPIAQEHYDPNSFLPLMFSSSALEGFNFSKVQDPELDQLLIDQAATVDPAVRGDILREIQRHIMEHAYVLPIHEPQFIYAFRSNVHGVKPDPRAWYLLWQDVWLDR